MWQSVWLHVGLRSIFYHMLTVCTPSESINCFYLRSQNRMVTVYGYTIYTDAKVNIQLSRGDLCRPLSHIVTPRGVVILTLSLSHYPATTCLLYGAVRYNAFACPYVSDVTVPTEVNSSGLNKIQFQNGLLA